eukprot:8773502-Heterocapsa_arctica.AAC.1
MVVATLLRYHEALDADVRGVVVEDPPDEQAFIDLGPVLADVILGSFGSQWSFEEARVVVRGNEDVVLDGMIEGV